MRISKLLRHFSLVALCAMATGCFPYHATTRMGVYGTVIDAESRAPLADARISFADGYTTNEPVVAISAADGSFVVPRKNEWEIRFIVGDYFTDKWIGGTVCIRHDGYETNTIAIVPHDAEHRFHTNAKLGVILLKPLSQRKPSIN